MAEKYPPSSHSSTASQSKDVKLKDRIHLFESLSNQPGDNKNMSANNSEQARYPKVVSPEHQRWTQVETEMHGVLHPPLPRKPGNNELRKGAVSADVRSPTATDRAKLRSAFVEEDQCKPPLPGKPELVKQRDVIYIEGTPVKLRNGRKCSADHPDARSTVLAMIKNFEKKRDSKAEEEEKAHLKQNGGSLDVIPTGHIRRRSADVSRLAQDTQESETRTRPDPQPRKLHRRRSKSVSDIHMEVEEVPEPQLPPSKPKRTFHHDMYMESKELMKQQQQQLPQTRGLKDFKVVNPLYEINSDDEILGNPNERPQSESFLFKGRHKELPPVPKMPPYTPPLARARDEKSVDDTGTERLRSGTSPAKMLDWHSSKSVQRSHSSVAVGKLKVDCQPHERKQVECTSNYDEAIPLSQKREAGGVGITKSGVVDPVIDAEGYSIPGSHLWKKPDSHGKKKNQTGRAKSFKGEEYEHVNVRFSEPNPSWRSVRIYAPKRDRKSSPGLQLGGIDNIDENDEYEVLRRDRKACSERRAVGNHTYTEPGSHVDSDAGPEPSMRQRGSRLGKNAELLRRKFNGVLRRNDKNPPPVQEEDRCSVTSEDSGGEVNEEVMQRRLHHVRAMKKHSSVYCTVDRNLRIFQEKKLFDYLVVISLEYNEETRRYQPVETFRHPAEISASQNDKLRAIPHFCFPDAFKWAPVETYNSESYSFVLTSLDGSRLYGYNRRLLPPGDKPRLPEVYCIITPVSCRLLYNKLLDEIEKRRHCSKLEMETLISVAYSRPFPAPGSNVAIPEVLQDGALETDMRILSLQRPQDSRLEHVDFECLFGTLEISQIIQVFASLLFERRIIMFSGKLSKLSKCSQAIAALLYPFAWQHVYVPVLPEKLIDMSCSPTPYIMGMLALCIPIVETLPIDEALLVDLDSRDFYMSVGDEDTIIPKKLSLALQRALRKRDKSPAEENNAGSDHEAQNREISEAFIHFFVETCGHYSNHFSSQYAGNLKFDREGFIAATPSRSIRRFLEVFTETQMFSLFIQEKEEESEGIAQGLFERRVKEWEAQCKVNANKLKVFIKIKKAFKDLSRGGKKVADTTEDERSKVKANLDAKI